VSILVRLDTVFPADIASVEVGIESVTISGHASDDKSPLFLADVPMEFSRDDPKGWEVRVPVKVSQDRTFRITLPRFRPQGSWEHDRLLSRWQLVRVDPDGNLRAASRARYPDSVTSRLPEPPPSR